MSLLSLVIALIVVGLVLYLLTLVPIDGTIKKVIHAVVIVAVIVWLLQSLGVFGSVEVLRIK